MTAPLADLVVALHFAFILFVVFGGFLVWRWRWAAWLHLPAVAWGAVVEGFGWICPLTPLEGRLRGEADPGEFVARYLLPVIYPEGLTREVQMGLGVAVVAWNALVYWRAAHNRRP